MTPGARVQAAIEVVELILNGEPAEKALTNWARGHRFAGSKDRAAIRDHVFAALRRWRSAQAAGGAASGRAIMVGLLKGQDIDPTTLFTGEGYAPTELSEEELSVEVTMTRAEALDCPDWVLGHFDDALGGDADAVLQMMRDRAPVFLRVNTARCTVDDAMSTLAQEGIVTRPSPVSPSALEVVENPRRVAMSIAYIDGLVELQDAASQAVVDALDIKPGMRVLDFCAGGGGKALAMAAKGAKVIAHDVSYERMKDIPERADRAQVRIRVVSTEELAAQEPFDLVVADAPCSGSGAWRRTPQGKWALTAERLAEICEIQQEVLGELPKYVSETGDIAYATCSLFNQENSAQIERFTAENSQWRATKSHQFTPLDGGDGFFLSLLTRD